MTKVKISNITINLDNKRKPLNGEDRSKISIEKKYPYCGANNIMDYVDEYLFDEEIICIAEDGGKWGADETCSYIMNEKCWINNHAHVLKVLDTNCTDIRYLKYWLNHKDLNGIITGAIVKKLTQKALNDIEIDIPSIEEQRNISNKLDTISNLIEYKKNQILKLNELIKSQYVEMFGDVENNSNNYGIVNLSDIADYWNGLTYKPANIVENGGTIVLRSSNIQESKIDYSDIVRVDCNIPEKKYVNTNDILMCSRNGSARLVGKVALIPNTESRMSFGAFMMIIRSKYYPYLFTYFQTNAFRKQISTGATTTINQITTNMMNKVKLPLPPIDKIGEFSKILKQIDKQKFVNLKIFQLLGKK